MKQVRGLQNRQTVAEAMARTGTTSPSAALRKLKTTENKRFSYLPHVGEKQRRKALLRIFGKLTDIQTPDGIRRGFTGLQLMQKPELGEFVKGNPELFTAALNMDVVFINEPSQQEAA